MNHPKGLTVDDKGNIYIADTMNMAIRKISDSGKSNTMYVIHLSIPSAKREISYPHLSCQLKCNNYLSECTRVLKPV